MLNKEKALQTPKAAARVFFFVDRRFGISNLELIQDIMNIVVLEVDSSNIN